MAEIQESIVGFELGPFVPPALAVTYGYLAESGTQGYVTGDIVSGAARSGSYGLNSNVTSAAAGGPNAVIRFLQANTSLPGGTTAWKMLVRYFFRISALPSANNCVISRVYSGTTAFAVQIQMNTSGAIRVVPSFCGNTTTSYAGSLSTNTWYCVHLQVYGNGSGGTADASHNSSYELEILEEDEVTQVALFSESTANGNNLPTVWPAVIELGQSSGVGGPSCTRTIHYDDFWCHMATDTDVSIMEWPFGNHVEIYKPTANGLTTQFTRGGVDTGANWSQVSEIPKTSGGGTQYVSTATAGNIDLYQHANLANSDWYVWHIQAVAFVLDTTTPQRLRIGETTYDVGTNATNGLYALAHQIYNNATAMDSETFNELEFGIKKQSGATTFFSEQEFLEVLTGPPDTIEEDIDGADMAVSPAISISGGRLVLADDLTIATGTLGFRLNGPGVEINVPTPWTVQQIQIGYRDEETS